jgi:uncharacterized membrane protein
MKVLGTVKDAATEVPLPGAKIRLYVREDELAVLQSDSEGKFRHESESQYIGEILICKVEKAGYEPQKVIQEFEEDEVTLAIKLVPGEEEKIKLTVNLKDEKRNPLKGVNISLEVDGKEVGVGISDKDGIFKITLSPDLEGRTITYDAELAGFELASGALLLKKGISHEITMKKLSVPPSDEKKEMKKTSVGLDENIAGLLCYVLGWLTGIVFLVLEKENKFVRFHAIQSLATFLPLSIIAWVIGLIPFIGRVISPLIGILALILWLILMFKAYKGEMYKLPVVGDFAEAHTQ